MSIKFKKITQLSGFVSKPTNPTVANIKYPHMEQSAGEPSSGKNWALVLSSPMFVNRSTDEWKKLDSHSKHLPELDVKTRKITGKMTEFTSE